MIMFIEKKLLIIIFCMIIFVVNIIIMRDIFCLYIENRLFYLIVFLVLVIIELGKVL